MENMAGIAGPQKPLITPHSAMEIAWFSIADTIFLTYLQKREKRSGRSSPPDNIKMQAG
jgi:hypothetical protein